MSRGRKRKKLNSAQLFTFTHAAHTSLLILFTHVKASKIYVCTHVKFSQQWKSTLREVWRLNSNSPLLEL